MNIFACHADSKIAARSLPDKLVVKMPLESAQILCTALWNRGEDAPYLPTHRKHPCVIWADQSKGNWDWLVEHGLALCDEYERRYGKKHKSEQIILEVAGRGPKGGTLQPFAMAMPDCYKCDDPVQAYRAFMVAEKTRYATWRSPASPPEWWMRALNVEDCLQSGYIQAEVQNDLRASRLSSAPARARAR